LRWMSGANRRDTSRLKIRSVSLSAKLLIIASIITQDVISVKVTGRWAGACAGLVLRHLRAYSYSRVCVAKRARLRR
jgi:hypothetical protein